MVDQEPSLLEIAEHRLSRFPKHPNPRQAPGVALGLLKAWVAEGEFKLEYERIISDRPNLKSLGSSMYWLMKGFYGQQAAFDYQTNPKYIRAFRVLIDALNTQF